MGGCINCGLFHPACQRELKANTEDTARKPGEGGTDNLGCEQVFFKVMKTKAPDDSSNHQPSIFPDMIFRKSWEFAQSGGGGGYLDLSKLPHGFV